MSNHLQKNGITSRRHLVHKIDGTCIGSWGVNIWVGEEECRHKENKRQNIHIARQSLRQILLNHVDPTNVHWGCRVLSYQETDNGVDLSYMQKSNDVEDKELSCHVDVLVGAGAFNNVFISILSQCVYV